MLRITQSEEDGQSLLRLEGKLVGPWVAELRGACERARVRGLPLALDLAEVSFADGAGVALLRELGLDAHIRKPSRFLAELLRSEESR